MFQDANDALEARFPAAEAAADGPLHLYHAPNSICSQKVRIVLMERRRPFASHVLDIFTGQTYDPAYVRLRAEGCAAAGLPLTRQHLGTTSVAGGGGCDACVVPTLVDRARGVALVDSRAICLDLDATDAVPGALIPPELRARILAEIDIVDNLPNYQVLAVGVAASVKAGAKNGFATSKVARCEALMAANAQDPVLVAAYEAKRDKEQMAAERLFTDAAMAEAHSAIAHALQGLETRLAATESAFLFGDGLTMADIFWATELIRADDLGHSAHWSNGRLPAVEAYFERLCALPSVREGILDWPGARFPRRPDVTPGPV